MTTEDLPGQPRPWVARDRYILVQPHKNAHSEGGWCAQVFCSSLSLQQGLGSWGARHRIFRYRWMAEAWKILAGNKYTLDWLPENRL